MPKIDPRLVKVRAEQLANAIIATLSGQPATASLGALSMALLYVLEDPTAPPRPQAMEDLLGAVKEFLAEFIAFSDRDAAFFAKKYGELDDEPKARPS